MYTFTHTIPVNPPGIRPTLSREQLWRGLVLRAEDPVAFVPGMESSEVLERFEHGLVREAVYRGQRIRERVTFNEPHTIQFQQVESDRPGAVTNTIGGSAPDLTLTFTFLLRFPGVPDDSDDERLRGEESRPKLIEAVEHTLGTVRTLAERDEL